MVIHVIIVHIKQVEGADLCVFVRVCVTVCMCHCVLLMVWLIAATEGQLGFIYWTDIQTEQYD